MKSSHLAPLLSYIEMCFPQSFEEIQKNDLISQNLFSPFVLDLPEQVLKQVEMFVSNIYQIKDSKNYHNSLPLPEDFESWPKTPSILSCFDFHYSEEMGLKLIEVNTNASLYLPIILQRCGQADHCIPPQLDLLYDSFLSAFDLKPGDGVSVFDEVPQNEGLYFEFIIFKEWLEQKGFKSNIVSLDTIEKEGYSNTYNRSTDFYFEEDKSKSLYEHYLKGTKKFSPNPREYFLMADKKRLTPLRNELEKTHPELSQMIPETKLFSEFDGPDDLWKQRKKYFFKPSQSFGSKGAFSGKGISRKAFEKIYSPQFIAQELCPAGRRHFEHEGESMEMKFDLRFFTFDGKVQNWGARLYQGQTTNMKTPFGGLTPIRWV